MDNVFTFCKWRAEMWQENTLFFAPFYFIPTSLQIRPLFLNTI